MVEGNHGNVERRQGGKNATRMTVCVYCDTLCLRQLCVKIHSRYFFGKKCVVVEDSLKPTYVRNEKSKYMHSEPDDGKQNKIRISAEHSYGRAPQ